MLRQTTGNCNQILFGGHRRISPFWICLLMCISIAFCQSSGAKGSTTFSTAKSSASLSPTHLRALATSGATAKAETSSSTPSRLVKSKETLTAARNASPTPLSVHTSSSAKLTMSGPGTVTQANSESAARWQFASSPKAVTEHESTALENSHTPASSANHGAHSAAYSSRQTSNSSVFEIRSDLHDVITSEAPTPAVMGSKGFRLSSSTGVERTASLEPTPSTTKTPPTESTVSFLTTTTRPPPKVHMCELGNGKSCVCLNCGVGGSCCTDEIQGVRLRHGVSVAIRAITTEEFVSRMDSIRNGIADVVVEACAGRRCAVEVEDTKSRRKRSAKSAENAAASGAAKSSVGASSPSPLLTRNSSASLRVVGAEVVIFQFSPQEAPSAGLNASFFVQARAQRDSRVNITGVLNGADLFSILEENAATLERRLNLSVRPISKWRRISNSGFASATIATQETTPVTTAVFPGRRPGP